MLGHVIPTRHSPVFLNCLEPKRTPRHPVSATRSRVFFFFSLIPKFVCVQLVGSSGLFTHIHRLKLLDREAKRFATCVYSLGWAHS